MNESPQDGGRIAAVHPFSMMGRRVQRIASLGIIWGELLVSSMVTSLWGEDKGW